LAVSEIDACAERARAARRELRGKRLGLLERPAGDSHVGAVLGEEPRRRLADPAVAADEQGPAAVEAEERLERELWCRPCYRGGWSGRAPTLRGRHVRCLRRRSGS